MEQTKNHVEQIITFLIYAFAAMLPLWVLPWRIGVELGREVTFGILIVGIGMLWLLLGLVRGGIRFHLSSLLWGGSLLFLVFGAATYFSKSPWSSLFFSDVSGEKLSTLFLGVFFMLVLASVLRSAGEVGILVRVLLFSGAVSGILTIITMFTGESPLRFIIPFIEGREFNVIGTINGLSLFYAALFSIGGGMLLNVKWNFAKYKEHVLDFGLILSLAVFLANLLLINFRTSWVVLLGAGVLFLGMLYQRMWQTKSKGSPFHITTQSAILMGFLAFSAVMIFVRQPILNFGLSAEITPSFTATWNIANSVFSEGTRQMLLGSGPGTFGLDWARYKDPSLNTTPFWDTRFGQGHSWFATLIPTAGVLGAGFFLLFLGAALFLFLKKIMAKTGNDSLADGLLLGFVSLLLTVFLYPANFSLILLLFATIGVLAFLLSRAQNEEEVGVSTLWKSFFGIQIVEKIFVSPWGMFFSSLISIFLVAIGFFTIYGEISRVRAALGYQAGVQAFSKGNFAEAIAGFSSAANFESGNFRQAIALVQAETEEIRGLIARAAGGGDVRQEFQTKVAKTVGDLQRVSQLYPEEPLVWRTRGALYELIIPFVSGSERFAFEAYAKASEKEPLNPGIWLEFGRAKLVFADRSRVMAAQADGSARQELEKAYAESLKEASEIIHRSVEVKQDYAQGHFLLAQVALRRGNIQDAIQNAENAKLSTPFDVGTAFQLGLLYYQSDVLDKAEAEFLRTVSINSNYSNARYFLGLIYDRKRQKGKAIDEFEKVYALNPNNKEIEKILENLRGGKSALSGIVPPGTPPEERNEVPINEKEK